MAAEELAAVFQPQLPPPPDGTPICVGFDGSENDDWTALQCETLDGYSFTPVFGPAGDKKPTIWNPAEFGGRIPRAQVSVAVDELFERYKVERMYCDPQDWYSEIGEWAQKHGEEHVFEWATGNTKAMWIELERFLTDMRSGRVSHDGCPIATANFSNAIRVPKPGQKYLIGKPYGAYHQKIDVAMARVLAHVAASDSRKNGWTAEVIRPKMFRFG
jgi:phage terminase large subunit-like protein